MAQDTLHFDEALKTVYEGGIRELIPTKVKLYNKFQEKDAKEWGGRFVEFPVRVGRNHGSGFGAEGGALPAAGRQSYATCRIPMRYQYGRVHFTAQVMKASQGSKAAFAPAMEQEMDGLLKDMTAEMGRSILYDGRGILALVNGTTTTTTVTVDSPGGVAGATNGARFVNPGQVLAAISPNTGALLSSSPLTVQSVPASGATFVRNDTTSLTDNFYLVKAANDGVTGASDTSYAKEPMGLLGLVDDGTYVLTFHGLNRTNYPNWASSVISNVGPISADVLQRGVDLADQKGDGNIDLLVMHHSVRRAYLAATDEQRRYVSGDLSKPDMGTVAAKRGRVTFGGIEIMEEKYAPYGIVFGCDSSKFTRYVEVAGEWADEDGSVLQRVGTGSSLTDAYEGVYRVWQNFHNEAPNAHFRLDGVTATVAVVHID